MNPRWAVTSLLVLGGAPCLCLAQTTPPPIRSESNVVLVPALVKTKSGELVLGLSARDFIVEDDGVEQSVQLDDSPDAGPISVVLALQVGRTAALQLQGSQPSSSAVGSKRDVPLSGLGTMLEAYVGEGKAAVAVVTFDSEVHLLQDFTEDILSVADRLRKVGPGDDGAAILDAVLYSNRLLDLHPAGGRRVIILISESRDHGSHVVRLDNVVGQLTVSNTLIYSLSFSPARSEFMRDAKGQNPETQINLMKPLVMAVNGLRKNVAGAVAELTGGEYETFTNRQAFDTQMDTLSGDDHNRYLLSFQPTSPRPGPHTIRVRLRNAECACLVTTRNMYWAIATQEKSETGR